MESAPKPSPAYVAYGTFKNFIEALNAAGAPPTHVDKSLMPNLSGGTQTHLLLTLKFLKLIEQDGTVNDNLRDLVATVADPGRWSVVLAKIIATAYRPILGNLAVATTTDAQLERAFTDNSGAGGSVVDRAIRFFLAASKDAKMPVSGHVGKRKPRKPGTKRERPAKTENGLWDAAAASNNSTLTPPEMPAGLVDFPLYFKGKPAGFVRVPKALTTEDCGVIGLTLEVIKAYAAQVAGA